MQCGVANKYPSRLATCRYCKKQDINRNKQIEGEEWISPSHNWYYHTECYKLKLEEDKLKASKSVTDKMQEEEWKESVYYFLKNEMKIVVNYQRLDKEWNRLINKGRTPKGIYFSLKYFYDIKKGDTKKSSGSIGIVDYIYEDATNYWCSREQREAGILAKIEKQEKEKTLERTIKIEARPRNKKKAYSMVDDDD